MALIFYRESTNSVVRITDQDTFEREGLTEESVLAAGFKVFDQDLDPEEHYSLALVLSEDGKSIVNRFPGKSLDEQRELIDAEEELAVFNSAKEIKKSSILAFLKSRIEELDWKLQRARDLDLINQNNQSVCAVYQEIQELKDKANAYSDSVDLLKTIEDVQSLPAKGFL